MFTWPTLELTEYEKKFVRVYKDGKYPGVLRRAYPILLNALADSATPGLEAAKLSDKVQIARRSRVFAISFAGNLGSWRLQIETASGEQMTPKGNADGYPVVSSMIAGGWWNGLSALGDQAVVNWATTPAGNVATMFNGNYTQGPMLIDPNWELSSNEALYFNGTVIQNQASTEFANVTTSAQKLLAIVVHTWEFPGMGNDTGRMGAGPQVEATAKSLLRNRG